MIFADCFWEDAAVVTSASADVAMSAIQASLAALQDVSALAANLPYVSPIAGFLLHVLTIRDVRVTRISF